jgi:hypothetical protein
MSSLWSGEFALQDFAAEAGIGYAAMVGPFLEGVQEGLGHQYVDPRAFRGACDADASMVPDTGKVR